MLPGMMEPRLMKILRKKVLPPSGDKRIEGSVWPKSIRGSPGNRGTCQIERAASESEHFMRFHVACPHCGEEQYLKFGDKETPFGFKWTPGEPQCVLSL
jgi:phage terminase large subunit GpA-like protein